MSDILSTAVNASNKKIYFIYNFRQVDDFMIIVIACSETKKTQQFVINYSDGRWETDVLSEAVDDEVFKLICRKLETIFYERANPGSQENLSSLSDMNAEAEFLLNI